MGVGHPMTSLGHLRHQTGVPPPLIFPFLPKGLNSLLGTAFLPWGEVEGGSAAAAAPTSPFPKQLLQAGCSEIWV